MNTKKLKVEVFRHGWHPVNGRFYFDNRELEIVNSYVYLGMLLHFSGKFVQNQKRLSQQGARALSSLLNSVKNIYTGTSQQCLLFNSWLDQY